MINSGPAGACFRRRRRAVSVRVQLHEYVGRRGWRGCSRGRRPGDGLSRKSDQLRVRHQGVGDRDHRQVFWTSISSPSLRPKRYRASSLVRSPWECSRRSRVFTMTRPCVCAIPTGTRASGFVVLAGPQCAGKSTTKRYLYSKYTVRDSGRGSERRAESRAAARDAAGGHGGARHPQRDLHRHRNGA